MAETLGKYLDANGVTDAKVRLRNDQPLRARNALDTADVNIIKVDSSNVVQLLSQTQISTSPSASNDIANKNYVDTEILGVTYTFSDGLQDVSNTVTVLAADTSLSVGVGGVAVNPATTSALSVSSGLLVNVDGVTLKINGSNELEGLKDAYNVFVLTGTNITNGYVDLSQEAASNSVSVFITGILQTPTTDYTLSTVGGVTRVTFAGDLLSAIATDTLVVFYRYL